MLHSVFPFPDIMHVENFKAIGSAQRIPIRPLTFLFGQNSVGKSSVLHAIALMAHFSQHGVKRNVSKVELNGTEVKTGDFKTYRHERKKTSPVVFGWQYKPTEDEPKEIIQKVSLSEKDYGLVVSGFNVSQDGEQTISAEWSSKHTEFAGIKRAYLAIHKINRKITDLHVEKCSNHLFQKIGLNDNLKCIYNYVIRFLNQKSLKAKVHAKVLDYFAKNELNDSEIILDNILTFRFSDLLSLDENVLKQLCDVAQSKDRRERISEILLEWLSAHVLEGVKSYMDDLPYAEMRKVVYFGKHRTEIGLDDLFTKIEGARKSTNLTTVEYHKGWTFNDCAVENLNEWLRKTRRPDLNYELRVVELDNIEGECDSKIMLRLYDPRQKKLVGFDQVGSGIGQMFPFLLSAYGELGSTILIEQPELHLHPALQAEIGDAFIINSLGSGRNGDPLLNRFVLETHSEHILLRVMRRIRETTKGTLPNRFPSVTPNDVAVLYMEKSVSTNESIVRELRLNEMGQLIDDWPGGFFEEGLREVLM